MGDPELPEGIKPPRYWFLMALGYLLFALVAVAAAWVYFAY